LFENAAGNADSTGDPVKPPPARREHRDVNGEGSREHHTELETQEQLEDNRKLALVWGKGTDTPQVALEKLAW
jgi:hypothetical protein